MMGQDHMLVALAWSILFAFYLESVFPGTGFLIYFMLGVVLGSLIPDVDAEDYALKHADVNRYGYLANIFPLVAQITTFVVYVPLSFIFKSYNHRGIMHSVSGIVANAVIWAVLIFLVGAITQTAGFTQMLWIPLGMLVGAFFHLVADTYTVSGVQWFYPKPFHPKGGIITNSLGEYLFVIIIGAVTVAMWLYAESIVMVTLFTAGELLALYPLSFLLGFFR